MHKVKEYILLKIKEETENSEIDCAHGINKENLNEHLVFPSKEKYTGTDANDIFYLWTVLEENPNEKDGYTIVFDEDCNDFGLGLHTKDGLMYLGNYGSFVETLNAM
ncbi:MAG TPA: hypothetical protein PL018_15740 [Ignavibacteriaceae bacterium]|nr:hypothetical protein [Ignavibacteriaceae bacterium]